jgi:hypothetical protein
MSGYIVEKQQRDRQRNKTLSHHYSPDADRPARAPKVDIASPISLVRDNRSLNDPNTPLFCYDACVPS